MPVDRGRDVNTRSISNINILCTFVLLANSQGLLQYIRQ